MKKYLPYAVIMSVLLPGCTSTPQWEASIRIKEQCRGRARINGCSIFAHDFNEKMREAGFQTKIVTYLVTGGESFQRTIKHQSVVWFNSRKEAWVIDNLTLNPRWSGTDGDQIADILAQFHAPALVTISNVSYDL